MPGQIQTIMIPKTDMIIQTINVKTRNTSYINEAAQQTSGNDGDTAGKRCIIWHRQVLAEGARRSSRVLRPPSVKPCPRLPETQVVGAGPLEAPTTLYRSCTQCHGKRPVMAKRSQMYYRRSLRSNTMLNVIKSGFLYLCALEFQVEDLHRFHSLHWLHPCYDLSLKDMMIIIKQHSENAKAKKMEKNVFNIYVRT